MNWLIENWTAVVAILASLGTPFAWFAGRRKEKASTKIVEGDAVKNMQGAYDTFVADQTERYEDLKKDMKYLKSELVLVKQENVEQRKDMRKAYSEVTRLRKEVRTWKDKYTSLKTAFDQLKKEQNG